MSATRIAVLLSCHNRRDITLRCLGALREASLEPGLGLQVILVDDGSTDGTAEAVRLQFPQTEILSGDGSLFWAGGMRKAFGHALAQGFDFYLWLNDDTILDAGAISSLVRTARNLPDAVRGVLVVGSTRDERTGALTYGGQRRGSALRPMRFLKVMPGSEPQRCDTVNGNCVLISAALARAIGNIDEGFVHGLGDFDYGLRVTRAGLGCWVMPGYVGTCSHNPLTNTMHDRELPLAVRWRKLVHRKGLPPGPWALLVRRHAGALWPLVWAWPYLKVLLTTRRIFPSRAHKSAQGS